MPRFAVVAFPGLLVLLAPVIAVPGAAHAQEAACPALLLSLDGQGRVSQGSKKAVADAAARGDSLRVGWRLSWGKRPQDGVQHWHDAVFVTVFEGEVFTQVPMIHRQEPKPGKRHIALSSAVQHWNALLGTDGMLVGRFSDGSAPREVRVAQTWCLAGAAAIACNEVRWRVAYRHDADGKPRAGSKAGLLAAIRRGDPVRLAWGAVVQSGSRPRRTVEQSADPISVSIAGGDEVYAQLADHIAQEGSWPAGKPAFDQPIVTWRGVMATDGTFDAIAVDRTSGKITRRAQQRVSIAWFTLSPEPACDTRRPLDLTRDPG